MNSGKGLRLAGIVAALLLVWYFVRFGLPYFGDVSVLAALLFLEILVVCVWRYEERFLVLLIVAFSLAGMSVPFRGVWTGARWAVLATGAVAGCIVWMKKERIRFGPIHVLALFCACAAFASATVSAIPQLASSKALSLFLLFLYGATGARAAAFGREERFFKGLLWGCEIVVYATAISYFVLGVPIWGNPNSLGAVMSVAVFPILLWWWFTSEFGFARRRRLAALLLCTFLIYFSFERAGMVAIVVVILAFGFALRQYGLLIKVAVLSLFLVAVIGIVNPAALTKSALSAKDAVLYKGHKEQGVLGSRRTPWEKTVSSVQEHPWFGTGYGTTATGEEPGLAFGSGRFASTSETSREHGSSYLSIVEWVGLLGVLPFIALMGVNAFHALKVVFWVRRSGHASHYSVPLAMVLLAGFIHAGFEDWMFAVGYYLCVYFWVLSFVLADLLPATGEVRLARPIPGTSRPATVAVGAIAPGR